MYSKWDNIIHNIIGNKSDINILSSHKIGIWVDIKYYDLYGKNW